MRERERKRMREKKKKKVEIEHGKIKFDNIAQWEWKEKEIKRKERERGCAKREERSLRESYLVWHYQTEREQLDNEARPFCHWKRKRTDRVMIIIIMTQICEKKKIMLLLLMLWNDNDYDTMRWDTIRFELKFELLIIGKK